MISARFCHRMVGYLEEEAVRTYTHCIEVGIMCTLLSKYSPLSPHSLSLPPDSVPVYPVY